MSISGRCRAAQRRAPHPEQGKGPELPEGRICPSMAAKMNARGVGNPRRLGTLRASLLCVLSILAVGTMGCPRAAPGPVPRFFIWSWERPDDLAFIDPSRVGVAFLAATIRLEADEVRIEPRFQPLRVPARTWLLAVVHVEGPGRGPSQGSEGWNQMLECLVDTASLWTVRGLQINFEATVSQRAFYRDLLNALRPRLPSDLPLTINALASWCLDDPWISDLPVDEAVPMMFRMGREAAAVRASLAAGRDFGPGICRFSVGVSTDEPVPAVPQGRKRFVFNPEPWTKSTLRQAWETLR
jgi:hypothetical protein